MVDSRKFSSSSTAKRKPVVKKSKKGEIGTRTRRQSKGRRTKERPVGKKGQREESHTTTAETRRKKKPIKVAFWAKSLDIGDTLSVPVLTRNLTSQWEAWMHCLDEFGERPVTYGVLQFPLRQCRSDIAIRSLTGRVSFPRLHPLPITVATQTEDEEIPAGGADKASDIGPARERSPLQQECRKTEFRPIITKSRKLRIRQKVMSHICQDDANDWCSSGDSVHSGETTWRHDSSGSVTESAGRQSRANSVTNEMPVNRQAQLEDSECKNNHTLLDAYVQVDLSTFQEFDKASDNLDQTSGDYHRNLDHYRHQVPDCPSQTDASVHDCSVAFPTAPCDRDILGMASQILSCDVHPEPKRPPVFKSIGFNARFSEEGGNNSRIDPETRNALRVDKGQSGSETIGPRPRQSDAEIVPSLPREALDVLDSLRSYFQARKNRNRSSVIDIPEAAPHAHELKGGARTPHVQNVSGRVPNPGAEQEKSFQKNIPNPAAFFPTSQAPATKSLQPTSQSSATRCLQSASQASATRSLQPTSQASATKSLQPTSHASATRSLQPTSQVSATFCQLQNASCSTGILKPRSLVKFATILEYSTQKSGEVAFCRKDPPVYEHPPIKRVLGTTRCPRCSQNCHYYLETRRGPISEQTSAESNSIPDYRPVRREALTTQSGHQQQTDVSSGESGRTILPTEESAQDVYNRTKDTTGYRQ